MGEGVGDPEVHHRFYWMVNAGPWKASQVVYWIDGPSDDYH